MNTSVIIGLIALVLAGMLATGHAFGQESAQRPAVRETAQGKLEQREALRRAAVAEQQKRKEDFARNCIRTGLTDVQLEACRAAYRRL
ncbi:MAG TPA: hypothetical protein VGX52_03210 [Burkholderiales bacterium]|nr:hypothetical protein [Burkholderiales bacterium]